MMGGCMSWMHKKNLPSRKITLAIFGLDNAGKTVTALGLKGESLDTLAPTIGFNAMEFTFGRFDITMFDLGGGKGIRGIWKNYYAEVYGLIYVLDSAESERFSEAKCVLVDLLENSKIAGKPILVLANKQDQEGAADEIDIIEAMSLEEMVNINKCPCRIETCAAIKGQGKKLDKAISTGMSWLIETIDADFENINARVERDTETQKKIDAEERKLRLERIQKRREEREKEEEEERLARGEEKKPETDDEEVVSSNPFKPVDVDDLTKKDEELKAKKKSIKLSDKKNDEEDNKKLLPVKDNILPPISPKHQAVNTKSLQINSKCFLDNVDDVENDNNHEIKEELINTYTQSPQRIPRTASPIPKSPIISRSADFATEDESDVDLSAQSGVLQTLQPLPRRLMPLDGGLDCDTDKKKQKKKKRKLRRNKTAPLVEEEENDVKCIESAPTLDLGWGTPASPVAHLTNRTIGGTIGGNVLAESQVAMKSKSEEVTTAFNLGKWGLAEDLPEIVEKPDAHISHGPNYDQDEIIT